VVGAPTMVGRVLLATASADKTARVWDTGTGESLAALTAHTSTVRGVAWATTSDGRLLLATASYDRTARIWDPVGGQCYAVISHPDEVNSVAFAPVTRDGPARVLFLATSCDDTLARLYTVTPASAPLDVRVPAAPTPPPPGPPATR